MALKRHCRPWERQRAFHRQKPQHNHPHYVGNGNESLHLDQVIAANPPEGGMKNYLDAMTRSDDQD